MQLLHLADWFNVALVDYKWKQFPVGEAKNQSISQPQKIVSKPQPVQQKF